MVANETLQMFQQFLTVSLISYKYNEDFSVFKQGSCLDVLCDCAVSLISNMIHFVKTTKNGYPGNHLLENL